MVELNPYHLENPEVVNPEEEDDLTFKDEVLPAPVLIDDPAMNPRRDGVHFVISNRYLKPTQMQTSLDYVDYVGEDFSFSLTDFPAQARLKDLKSLSDHVQIKKAEMLSFYFQGYKLNHETTIRQVLKQFQKDDRGKPVIIYCAEVAFHLFSAR